MKREKNTYPYDVAAIILSYLRGDIREEDRDKLEAWLQASDSHRVLFARICDEKLQYEDVYAILSRDANRAWGMVTQKAKAGKRHRLIRVFRVAASVIVLLSVGFLAWTVWSDNQMSGVRVEVAEILPGRSTAILTTASGTTFQLDTMNNVELSSASAKNDGKEVVFEDRMSGDSMAYVKYNTIKIPRGGEYRITLGDGTRVYLNAQTELKFPESFSNSRERVVHLSGEAYFNVAKDGTKPFIVYCKGYAIKVLGTSFNVASYEDEIDSRTTLASGKVEINVANRRVVLKPGQQAIVKGGEVDVKEVEVEVYTTWMHENFRFQSENIEEIMKKLSRWYNVDVFYASQNVRNFHFTGYLPRYANITDVLELLSLTTNIKFEVKGMMVMVMEK